MKRFFLCHVLRMFMIPGPPAFHNQAAGAHSALAIHPTTTRVYGIQHDCGTEEALTPCPRDTARYLKTHQKNVKHVVCTVVVKKPVRRMM